MTRIDNKTFSRPLGGDAEVNAFGLNFQPAVVCFWLVGIAAAFNLLVIARLHPMYSPLTRMLMLGGVVSLLTAAFVAVESDRLQLTDRLLDRIVMTPVHWFALVLLVWPVGFPLYFAERARVYPGQHIRTAWTCTGIYIITVIIVSAGVHSKRRELEPIRYKAGASVRVNGRPIVVKEEAPRVIQLNDQPVAR